MKLELKKSVVKNLSKDDKKLPMELTPQVAGGAEFGETINSCPSDFCANVAEYEN